MVSIRTGLTLGVIAIGVVLFLGLGGASGIGTRIGSSIGGGLRSFSESLTGSLLSALNPFAEQGGQQVPAAGTTTTPSLLGAVSPLAAILSPIVQQAIAPEPIVLEKAREEFIASKEPIIAAGITSFADIVPISFLEQISFQPPTTGLTLDVSKTFRYLAADGITSEEAAIAQLIRHNSTLFPEFFG